MDSECTSLHRNWTRCDGHTAPFYWGILAIDPKCFHIMAPKEHWPQTGGPSIQTHRQCYNICKEMLTFRMFLFIFSINAADFRQLLFLWWKILSYNILWLYYQITFSSHLPFNFLRLPQRLLEAPTLKNIAIDHMGFKTLWFCQTSLACFKLHCVFLDLEKSYDGVLRQELWYCTRRAEVVLKYPCSGAGRVGEVWDSSEVCWRRWNCSESLLVWVGDGTDRVRCSSRVREAPGRPLAQAAPVAGWSTASGRRTLRFSAPGNIQSSRESEQKPVRWAAVQYPGAGPTLPHRSFYYVQHRRKAHLSFLRHDEAMPRHGVSVAVRSHCHADHLWPDLLPADSKIWVQWSSKDLRLHTAEVDLTSSFSSGDPSVFSELQEDLNLRRLQTKIILVHCGRVLVTWGILVSTWTELANGWRRYGWCRACSGRSSLGRTAAAQAVPPSVAQICSGKDLVGDQQSVNDRPDSR